MSNCNPLNTSPQSLENLEVCPQVKARKERHGKTGSEAVARKKSQKQHDSLIGLSFGRLVVLSILRRVRMRTMALCECSCGKVCEVNIFRLKSLHTKSCGCLKEQKNALGPMLNHGLSKTTEHVIWRSMIYRCHREKCNEYKFYGARGISVCDRWRYGDGASHPFILFLADMGNRPSKYHSLDRSDNNGNYSPENCHWGTRVDQARNRRSTVFVHTPSGTHSLTEFCRLFNINISKLTWRMQKYEIGPLDAACMLYSESNR